MNGYLRHSSQRSAGVKILLGMAFLLQAGAVAGQQVGRCVNQTVASWSPDERNVWRRLCSAGRNTSTTEKASGVNELVLSSAFLRAILSPPLNVLLEGRPIRIVGARIVGSDSEIDLS